MLMVMTNVWILKACVYSGGGIKRNLKFYFDITVCDMHDLPVTVNKGRSIEGFFPGRCQGGALFTFISMEMREGTEQPVKVSFSCGRKRTSSSNLVSDGMIKQF